MKVRALKQTQKWALDIKKAGKTATQVKKVLKSTEEIQEDINLRHQGKSTPSTVEKVSQAFKKINII